MLTPEQLGWESEPDEAGEMPSSDILFDLGELLGLAARYAIVLIVTMVCGGGLCFAYLKSVPPRYASGATIALDIKQMLSVNNRLDPSIGIPKDSLLVTQLQLIQSDANILRVIDELGLENAEVFRGVTAENRSEGLIGRAAVWFGARRPQPEQGIPEARQERRIAIVRAIQKYLLAEQVPGTYVMLIKYMSTDPELGSKIANSVASNYLTEQLLARYDATLRQEDWIKRRADELKQQATDASRAVEDYRRASGIVSTAGRSLNDRELQVLGTSVGQANDEIAKRQAKLDRINVILQSAGFDGDVSDAAGDSTIVGLRKTYVDQVAALSRVRQDLGSDSEAAGALERQIQATREQLRGELRRLAGRYLDEQHAAAANLDDLRTRLRDAQTVFVEEGKRSVQLRELERFAQTTSAAHSNFLRGFFELTQKHPFPTSEARMINQATPALGPSYPTKTMTLINSLAASAVVAFAFIMLHSRYRPRFRTRADIRQIIGADCLAELPGRIGDPRTGSVGSASPQLDRAASDVVALIRARGASSAACPVVAVMEALPRRNRTMLADGLASATARRGGTVMLLRLVGADGRAHAGDGGGLDGARADPAGDRASAPGVKVPALVTIDMVEQAKRADILHRIDLALRAARQSFDLVVIDAPPLSRRAEAAAAAGFADAVVLAVQRETPYGRLLRSALDDNRPVRAKLIGAVLLDARANRMTILKQSVARLVDRLSSVRGDRVSGARA